MDYVLIVLGVIIVWAFILKARTKDKLKLASNASVDLAASALIVGIDMAYESIGDTTESEQRVAKRLAQLDNKTTKGANNAN